MSEPNRVIDSYVVDLCDFPLRYVAVVRTAHGNFQASCFTYRGARRWVARTVKRAHEGTVPA